MACAIGGGVVGWANNVPFAHVLDATLLDVYLHGMFTCMGCLLACAHVLDAMPLDVFLHVHTYVMLRA